MMMMMMMMRTRQQEERRENCDSSKDNNSNERHHRRLPPFLLTSLLLLMIICTLCHQVVGYNTTTTKQKDKFEVFHHRFLTPNYRNDDESRQAVKVDVPTSPEGHLVTDLPLLSKEAGDALEQYAGLLPASPDEDKYLFYWYFLANTTKTGDKHRADSDIPLVLWLNGGPGCSSTDGLFIENGPLKFVQTASSWELQLRESSWHKSPAYIVYLDQPVATGLSFTTNPEKQPKNDEEVNADFYHWLQEFLWLHSNTLLNEDNTAMRRPLYFAGESHAGHYIPSMMAYILQQQQYPTYSNAIHIDLGGGAIGNGWIDPPNQYAAAAAAYGHGIIGRAQQAALDEKERECRAILDKKVYLHNTCMSLVSEILQQSHGRDAKTMVHRFDIRESESRQGDRDYPPGVRLIEAYLGGRAANDNDELLPTNTYDVLKALHSTESWDAGQRFQEVSGAPSAALIHQDGLGVTNEIRTILDHKKNKNKIRLLFFNGMMDLVCNHVGNEIALEQLSWQHQKDWIRAPRHAWLYEDKVAGYMKEYENLGFLKLLNSGHMVPMDQPEIALDVIRTFLYPQEKTFDSYLQNLKRSTPLTTTCPESYETV